MLERASFGLVGFVLLFAGGSCNSVKKSDTPSPEVAIPAPPPPSSSELPAMAKSNDEFAFDLFGKVRARRGNLAISPLSIRTSLTMAWAGAKGETAAEMKRVLHLEGSPRTIAVATERLVVSFRDPARKVTLRIVNRLFGDEAFEFAKSYLDTVAAGFESPLEKVDFRGAPESARGQINEWVSHQTEDRIKDLLPPGSLQADTRLLLVNATYFLGAWERPFVAGATRSAPFRPAEGPPHDVPTMHRADEFAFAALDGVKVLEMPYAGGDAAMLFVLPDKTEGIEALEQGMQKSSYDRWLSALKPARVDVALPRFKVEPAAPISLSDDLRALGMATAFSDQADFTGMATSTNPDDRLRISKVFHKAFVKIDEKGTEAAAGTAVQMVARGLPPPAELSFHADHPFLFFLRDPRSGEILFMGRVSDPGTP